MYICIYYIYYVHMYIYIIYICIFCIYMLCICIYIHIYYVFIHIYMIYVYISYIYMICIYIYTPYISHFLPETLVNSTSSYLLEAKPDSPERCMEQAGRETAGAARRVGFNLGNHGTMVDHGG